MFDHTALNWQNGLGYDGLQNIYGLWKGVVTAHNLVRVRNAHSELPTRAQTSEHEWKNLMTSYKWTLPLQQHHISQLFSRGTRIMLSWGRQNIWRRFWCNLFLMTTAWQGSHYESMKLMVYGKLWCQTTRCQRWNHHSQLPKHLTFVSVTRKVWRQTEQKSEQRSDKFWTVAYSIELRWFHTKGSDMINYYKYK